MEKDRIFSIIRYILSAVGTWMIGHQIWGAAVDSALWQSIAGGIMTVVSVIWGFTDKTVTLEGFQGAIRQIIAIAGGLAVAKGIISTEAVVTITGIVVTVSAWVYSWLSKKKTERLANPSDPLTVAHLNGGEKKVA